MSRTIIIIIIIITEKPLNPVWLKENSPIIPGIHMSLINWSFALTRSSYTERRPANYVRLSLTRRGHTVRVFHGYKYFKVMIKHVRWADRTMHPLLMDSRLWVVRIILNPTIPDWIEGDCQVHSYYPYFCSSFVRIWWRASSGEWIGDDMQPEDPI